MKYRIFLFLTILTFISCRNEPARREYQEAVVHSDEQKTAELSAGYAAREGLPEGHPPIDGLPEGHPSIDSLPPGHPPIGDMAMNDPAMKAMIAGSAVEAPVVWTTPEGWTEMPGDGMRLATLKSSDGSVQISVTSFGGQVGGVEGNVIRWLGQLGMNPDEAALKKFIDESETVISSGALNVQIFRFTSLSSGGSDPSMIAAMTDIPGAKVFLKMTGTAEDLEKHFSAFHDFCQSIDLKQ